MTKNDTVGSIVAKDIRAAHVFKLHQIDFCCGGGISIEKACSKKGLDPEKLIAELQKELELKEKKLHDFDKWSVGFLSDYIENVHHNYTKQNLPILEQYANKVAKVHGQAHPYLVDMAELVNELSNEFMPHLLTEENILFPYIKSLEKEPKPKAPFGSVKNPIQAMMNEHDATGHLLKELSEISNQFDAPEYACNTWKAYYNKLAEFQEDVQVHIHLENNILFPKAIELENM